YDVYDIVSNTLSTNSFHSGDPYSFSQYINKSARPITPRPTRRSPRACFLFSSKKYGVALITLSCIRVPIRTVSFNFSKLTVLFSLSAISARFTAAKLHTEYGASGCSPHGFVATTF